MRRVKAGRALAWQAKKGFVKGRKNLAHATLPMRLGGSLALPSYMSANPGRANLLMSQSIQERSGGMAKPAFDRHQAGRDYWPAT